MKKKQVKNGFIQYVSNVFDPDYIDDSTLCDVINHLLIRIRTIECSIKSIESRFVKANKALDKYSKGEK